MNKPEDLYLQAVINPHSAANAPDTLPLTPLLQKWTYSRHVESITLSGSHPKGTDLRDSDADIFLSLAPNTPGPLSDIHQSLAEHFRDHIPRPRNVSLRINHHGAKLDLVPARRRADSTTHTLWQQRYNTWLQTDIARQIEHVKSSRLQNEIRALKIWRRRHTFRFPSFLLELNPTNRSPSPS